jgi:integrase
MTIGYIIFLGNASILTGMARPAPLTGPNKEVLDKFERSRKLKGLKDTTINLKLWVVTGFARYHNNKDLREMGKDEIEEYILHRRDTRAAKTADNDLVDLKVFYNWLVPDNNYFEDLKRPRKRRMLPSESPVTAEDIKLLLQYCKTQRNRAIIALTWDTAGRVSEILGLNVGNIVFDQYGMVVVVNGKTGMRRIRTINATPEVQLWLNQHPYRDNPDAPLFTTQRAREGKFKRMDIRTVENVFKQVMKDSGIKKNIHPHALRHGKLTEMVKNGMGEMELRLFAGWEVNSDMPSTYLHLSGADLDKKILTMNGIVEEDDQRETPEALKPIECPRCHTKNPSDAKYCSHCSLVLDAKTAIDLQDNQVTAADLFAKRIQDPEFIAKVAQMMQEGQKRD